MTKVWSAWHSLIEAKWKQRVEKACQSKAQEVCMSLTNDYETRLASVSRWSIRFRGFLTWYLKMEFSKWSRVSELLCQLLCPTRLHVCFNVCKPAVAKTISILNTFQKKLSKKYLLNYSSLKYSMIRTFFWNLGKIMTFCRTSSVPNLL